MNNGHYKLSFQSPFLHHILALLAGVVIGLDILPEELVMLLVFGTAMYVLLQGFIGKKENAFAALPYLCYIEIYCRDRIMEIPYLFLPYFFILFFVMMLIKQWPVLKFHSRSFAFLFFFVVIEVVNSSRSTDPENSRVLVASSVALFFISLWASCNVLTNTEINRLLYNVKLAGIFICGIILVSQITHDISYGTFSMSEAMNGLAPVQISGYLGLCSILYFLSIMQQNGRGMLLINITAFLVSTTFLALSFSRGGLYFLAATIGLYFLFNFRKVSNLYLLLLLVPIAFLAYTFTIETTNGLILERFNDTNTSGRNLLVDAGLSLFSMNPLIGFGTGNFNAAILEQQLYHITSGAHNEFIRVLAEHGLAGFVPYVLFYLSLGIDILKRKKFWFQMAAFLFVLFCMIIIHNGLKISIQPLILFIIIATPYEIRPKAARHPGAKIQNQEQQQLIYE